MTNFHERKKINVWYIAGIIFILFLGILFYYLLDHDDYYYDVAVLSYWGFVAAQIYGWIAGLFKKKEANAFFQAFAIDMLTHLLGAFSLFINFYLLLNIPIGVFTIMALVAGPLFEFFEFCVEILLTYIDAKSKRIKIKYKKNISESLGNIFQDIFFDALGVMLALSIFL